MEDLENGIIVYILNYPIIYYNNYHLKDINRLDLMRLRISYLYRKRKLLFIDSYAFLILSSRRVTLVALGYSLKLK